MGDDTKPARADVSAGDKVAGYQLEEQIGQGGMAVVYRAHDERLDRQVALKVLSPALAADTAFRTRFIRESRAAAAVDHPNIIPVYDAGDAGGCLFISMRYVQGGDVRSLIADGHPLPAARAWNIISQVASALDAAHARDLVHRDVKPANMLLDRRAATEPDAETTGPAKEHVYLSDFGISKQTVASNLTSTGQFVGTLDYIAPEQIEGKGLDGRADQYSLACAAYELLSGVPPFSSTNGFALINSHLSEQARPITTLRPGLPQAVDLVLAKAMSKTAAERYASCDQFAADLGRALGVLPGHPEVARQPPAGQPASHPMTELAQPGPGPLAAAAAAGLTPGQLPTNQQALAYPETMQATPPATPRPPLHAPAMTGGQAGAVPASPGVQPGDAQQAPPGQPWAGGYPGQQPGYGQYPPPYQTYPTPGGPGGPTGPGWPQYPPPQQPKRSRGMLIGSVAGALAIVVAGGVVAFAAFHHNTNNNNGGGGGNNSASTSPPITSTPPTTPATTAKDEAISVNDILTSMIATRNLLLSGNGLVNDVSACNDPAGSVREARQVYDQRSSEYQRARSVDTGLLANGSALKSELVKAVSYSLTYDHDLLLWARQQKQSNCTVGTGSAYYPPLQSGSSLNLDATNAKQVFLSNWNSIAPQYQQPTYPVADPPI